MAAPRDLLHRDQEKYLLLYGAESATRLDDAACWQRLFLEIDQRGLLARKAAELGSFRPLSEDLEHHLIPAATRQREWLRCVRYTQIACNLRGLAESVADETVLAALVGAGKLTFTEEILAQLSSPAVRARARAVAAQLLDQARNHLPSRVVEPALGRLAQGVENDVQAALDVGGSAATDENCALLAEVAQRLGPALARRWPGWIADLNAASGATDPVWSAIIAGYLARGFHDAPLVQEAVSNLSDSAALLRLLERYPSELAPQFLDSLETGPGVSLLSNPERWIATLSWLSQSRLDGNSLAAHWEQSVQRLGPPPWTSAFLERGRCLWPHLTSGGTTFPSDLPAHLWLPLRILLGEQGCPALASAMSSDALSLVQVASERFHWGLRLLAARSGKEPVDRRLLSELLATLRSWDFSVPFEDLSLAFDLVSSRRPRELRALLEEACWSPAGSPTMLRELLHRVTARPFFDEILQQAEIYATTVEVEAADAFSLRRDLVSEAARWLSRATQGLDPLQRASEHLLPAEEDELRAKIASDLALQGRSDLSEEVAGGIRGQRLRWLTQLKVCAAGERAVPSELLSPAAIYQAVASIESAEEELQALTTLLDEPTDPRRQAAAMVEGLSNSGRSIVALADWAHHCLHYQQRALPPNHRDRLLALDPLRQALGVVQSEAWLLALVPDLVELGAVLGATAAAEEIKEAVERIVAFEGASWPLRERALEAVIALIPHLSDKSRTGKAPDHPSARYTGTLLRWFDALPNQLPHGPARIALRKAWHRLYPQVLAAADRCLVDARRAALHPVGTWLSDGPLQLALIVGRSRFWRLWQVLTKPVATLRRRHRSMLSTAGLLSGRYDGGWAWLNSEQRTTLRSAVDSWDPCLATAQTSAQVAAIELLAWRDGADALALAEALAPGPMRDHLCTRLIEDHRVPLADVPAWAGYIDDHRLRLRALAIREATSGQADPANLPDLLAQLVAQGSLDPGDPETSLLRRGLWRIAPTRSLEALAPAIPSSLANAGREGGERALRWLLNALLAPQLGRATHERLTLAQQLKQAIQDATRLDIAPEPGRDERGKSDHDDDGDHPTASLRSFLRRWRWAVGRSPIGELLRRSTHDTLSSVCVLFLISWSVPLVSLDASYWLGFAEPVKAESAAPLAETWAWLAILFVALADGLLLGSYLSLRAPATAIRGFRRSRQALRAAIFLLASIPVVGLLAIPFSKSISGAPAAGSATTKSWRDAAPTQRLARAGPRLRPLLHPGRWLCRQPVLVVFYIVNLALPIVVVLPVSRTLESLGGHRLASAATLGVHLLCVAAAAVHLSLCGRRQEGFGSIPPVLLSTMALLWLLPAGSLAGLLAYAVLGTWAGRVRDESLCRAGLRAGGSVTSLPLWHRFEHTLVSRWRSQSWWHRLLWRPPSPTKAAEPGEIAKRTKLVLRCKAVLLAFEVAVATVCLHPDMGPTTLRDPALFDQVRETVQGLLLLAAGVGLAVAAGFYIRDLFSAQPATAATAHRVSARYCAGVPLGLAAGLASGDAIWHRDLASFASVVVTTNGLLAAVQFGSFLLAFLSSRPESAHHSRDEFFCLLAPTAVALWGLDMLQISTGASGAVLPEAGPGGYILGACALTTGTIVAALNLRTLLRPVNLSTLLNGSSDTADVKAARRLALFLLMPLGAVTLPLWPWWQQRLTVSEGCLRDAALTAH